MTSKKSILAKNIEERTEALGIKNPSELAKRAGINRTILNKIEREPDKTIHADNAAKLARALQCSMEWLVTGEESEHSLEHIKTLYGAAFIKLEELTHTTPQALRNQVSAEQYREYYLSPTGLRRSLFVIRITHNIAAYSAGSYLFFDFEKIPENGSLILVQMGENSIPEIVEYCRHGNDKEYFKYLNVDLPPELRFIERNKDMKLLATLTASSVF